MSEPSVAQFRKELSQMDEWLKEHRPDVFQSLQKPANDKQLARLSARVFDDKPIPPVIKLWFQWHNGQTLNGAPFFPLYKHSAFYLTPISETIQIHRDMMALRRYEESAAWSDRWLPLFAGEYGDALVFVTGGKDKHGIRAWWHETKKNELVSANITRFLARARRELSKATGNSSKQEPRPGSAVPKSWIKGTDLVLPRAPSPAQLAKDPIGTAYLVGPYEMPIFYPSKGHYVAIKVGSDLWISVFDRSRDDALAAIRDAVTNVPTKKWAHTVDEIASELGAEDRIFKRKIRQRTVQLAD